MQLTSQAPKPVADRPVESAGLVTISGHVTRYGHQQRPPERENERTVVGPMPRISKIVSVLYAGVMATPCSLLAIPPSGSIGKRAFQQQRPEGASVSLAGPNVK